jgi:hypothetical protein
MTITLPPGLKARMERVEEHVNWSAVAAQAFEQKLAEIIQRRGAKTMEDAITRLRASKQKSANEDYQPGYKAGQAWAANRAETIELDRLEEFCQAVESDPWGWEGWIRPSYPDAFSPAENLVFKIDPDNQGRDVARAFWQVNSPTEEIPSGDFAHGFAMGAVAFWMKVKDQL